MDGPAGCPTEGEGVGGALVPVAGDLGIEVGIVGEGVGLVVEDREAVDAVFGRAPRQVEVALEEHVVGCGYGHVELAPVLGNCSGPYRGCGKSGGDLGDDGIGIDVLGCRGRTSVGAAVTCQVGDLEGLVHGPPDRRAVPSGLAVPPALGLVVRFGAVGRQRRGRDGAPPLAAGPGVGDLGGPGRLVGDRRGAGWEQRRQW